MVSFKNKNGHIVVTNGHDDMDLISILAGRLGLIGEKFIDILTNGIPDLTSSLVFDSSTRRWYYRNGYTYLFRVDRDSTNYTWLSCLSYRSERGGMENLVQDFIMAIADPDGNLISEDPNFDEWE